MTESTIEIKCIRVKGTSRYLLDERIAVEAHLKLIINGEITYSFIHSPGLAEQLVIGHLLSEGVISTRNDIDRIEITSDHIIELWLKRTNELKEDSSSEIPLSMENLLGFRKILRDSQKLHKSTRGFHGALLVNLANKNWFMCEDIGRHNAVDKVIGFGSEMNYNFVECLLLVSGRLISNIVSKGSKTGIAAMASMTVATDEGIRIAQQSNMTLIGALSDAGFWLYNEGRVKISP